MHRRNALRALGLSLGAAATTPLFGFDELGRELAQPTFGEFKPTRPVTLVTLGAGNRGNVYGDFAKAYPEQLKVVGAAEPIDVRRARYASKHDIPKEQLFTTWEHVFERPKFADAVLISTPDDLHYGPCMAALEAGYHVLLEKPIAPTEQECRDILAAAERTGRIVAVCHVLRYAPYFEALRDHVRTGKLGRLISVQHFEPIEHQHMAHSFVRGNWHNSAATTPIILAKSCHDLDILRWIIGEPCQEVSAFGDLTWFKKANQPAGATARCQEGCAVEPTCPYSALKIYDRDGNYTYVFDLPEDPALHKQAVLDYLRTTDYGRCVYDMDNDQCDHYVVNMRFGKEVTASFSMEAFTSYHGRRTRLMGSHGDLVGDMSQFVFTDFLTGERTEWAMSTDGHGGGDWKLAADFVRAVDAEDASLLTSTVQASVESHLMGFAAERSRKAGEVVKV